MPAHIEDHPLNQGAAAPSTKSSMGRDTLLAVAVMVVGIALLIGGYIGISGTTNTSDQLSYLASATLPGAAVLIAGAVLASRAATVAQQRDTAALRSQVDAVVAWLASASSEDTPTEEPPG